MVTNTTPLITLAGVGLLDLLPSLYGTIWAPRIVLDEYQAKLPPTEPDLAQVVWLTVVDSVIIDPTLPLLDAGEAAAISLAQSIEARLILLDERKARRIATRLGCQSLEPWLCYCEPNDKVSSLKFDHILLKCKDREEDSILNSLPIFLRMPVNNAHVTMLYLLR